MHAIATTAITANAVAATHADQATIAPIGEFNISPVSDELAARLEHALETQLRICAHELLSIPGFTLLHIDFDAKLSPQYRQSWNLNVGVSSLSAHAPATVSCELDGDGRWHLRFVASYVEDWITQTQAQKEAEVLSAQVAKLLASAQVRQQIRREYQSQDYWFGYSKTLSETESRIKKLAHVRLPLVLIGEKGTGKLPAAMTLHCYRHAHATPFIKADCRTWEPNSAAKQLQTLAANAQGGSLYLAHTESLKGHDQSYLRDFATHLKSDFFLLMGSRCKSEIDALSNDAQSDFLEWAEFHCLCMRLPCLRERVQDIRAFTHCFLAESQLKLRITSEAWDVLESYSWPENGHQLQSVLKKAASLVEDELDAHHLFEWFPSMQLKPYKLHQDIAVTNEALLQKMSSSSLQERRDSFHGWFGLKQPQNEHPALMRALEHIWKNYQQALSLNSVADKACVSASHLSYLFKQRLQRSFKQILTEIRIDKAKHIFENMPARQITQVCMDVGFADLSHFEKTFKRLVGLKPRCYRQQFRQPLSTQT